MIIALIILLIILAGACGWLYFAYKTVKDHEGKLISENERLLISYNKLEIEKARYLMKPHAVNNLLANLKITASKLNKGLDSLSLSLEYIIYKGKDNYVAPEDEINFIKELIRMHDLFISEIDAIKEDYSSVNKNSKQYKMVCIPHLISGYFIENAFKHGDISEKESMRVSVKLTDKEFELNVINKTRQKANPAKGGLGLANMEKRLELLIPGKYSLQNNITDDEFHASLNIQF